MSLPRVFIKFFRNLHSCVWYSFLQRTLPTVSFSSVLLFLITAPAPQCRTAWPPLLSNVQAASHHRQASAPRRYASSAGRQHRSTSDQVGTHHRHRRSSSMPQDLKAMVMLSHFLYALFFDFYSLLHSSEYKWSFHLIINELMNTSPQLLLLWFRRQRCRFHRRPRSTRSSSM